MIMEDLSHMVQSLTAGESMSAGNTIASPDSARMAMTAPGSESILPPSPTHDQLITTPPGRDDFAHLLGPDGSRETRPAESGGPTTFQESAPWRQT